MRFVRLLAPPALLALAVVTACGDDSSSGGAGGSGGEGAGADGGTAGDTGASGGAASGGSAGEAGSAGDTGMGGDVGMGGDMGMGGSSIQSPCMEDERVATGSCVACPTGSSNPAGDDPAGGDTSCQMLSVYWASAASSVKRVDVGAGTMPTDVITGATSLFSVAADPVRQKIYYNDAGDVIEIAPDGSSPSTRFSGVGVFGIAVGTGDEFFASDFNADAIYRVQGATSTKIVDIRSPSGLYADLATSKLYYTTYNTTVLAWSNLDGSSAATLQSPGGQGTDAVVFGDKVYYANRSDDIFRCDLDGSNNASFITGQGAVQGLALDPVEQKLYWTAAIAGEIRRADISDGGNIETIQATVGTTWGVAVMRRAVP